MKILSIDIGIKNLAYSILNHESGREKIIIEKWDIINLCNKIPCCSSCKKPAKFTKKDNYYCKKHAKNSDYLIPFFNIKKLNKQPIKDVMIIADKCDILYEKTTKKATLIKLIEDFSTEKCLNCIETVNASTVNLIDIGITLNFELNNLFREILLDTIDLIILENQISPIANRMKTLQGMMAQYFISNGNYKIEFMSAANKLKLFSNTKKTTYAERKKMSIQYTTELLTNKNMYTELDFFKNHKKKDDLADCLLQGIYYLSAHNKLLFDK